MKIRRGAACAVTGKICFATVGVEDPNYKISIRFCCRRHHVDAISACAVMAIANAARKVIKIVDGRKVAGFKDDVIVAKAMKLGEADGH